MDTASLDADGRRQTRSKELTVLALAVGILGALLCGSVVYRTAQLADGDGTGMQWVVLGPMGFVLFGIVVPALIIGITGLRIHRAAAASAIAEPQQAPVHARVDEMQKQEGRALRILLKFILIVVVLIFGVLPLIMPVILAIAE